MMNFALEMMNFTDLTDRVAIVGDGKLGLLIAEVQRIAIEMHTFVLMFLLNVLKEWRITPEK